MRRTNIFYTSGPDSKFLTFSNWTEAMTGNFASVDTKLFPSRFICGYIPDLNSVKPDLIQWLSEYYESKMAVLRDDCGYNDKHPDNNIMPLKDLLKALDKYGFEPVNISNITEEDWNGTFTDVICTVNPAETGHKYEYGYVSGQSYNNSIYTYESEYSYIPLYGWQDGELSGTVFDGWSSYFDNSEIKFGFTVNEASADSQTVNINTGAEIKLSEQIIHPDPVDPGHITGGPVRCKINSDEDWTYMIPGVIGPNDNTPLFEITDSKYSDFEVIEDINDAALYYTRSFTKDVYAAWCLPIDLTLTKDILEKFKFQYFKYISFGSQSELNSGSQLITEDMKEGDVVKANIPYIVFPLETTTYTFKIFGDIKKTVSNSLTVVDNIHGYKYSIIGIYNKKTYQEDDIWYAVTPDGYLKLAGSGAYLMPFRWYLQSTDLNDTKVKLPSDISVNTGTDTGQTSDNGCIYYYDVKPELSYLRAVSGSSINTLSFNTVIPLFELTDIDDDNVDTAVTDNVEYINLSSIDNNMYTHDVPLGIWLGDETVTLNQDSDTGLWPQWSLAIAGQFKPLPYSAQYSNETYVSSIPADHVTMSQVLAAQSDVMNRIDSMLAEFTYINNRLTILETQLSHIATSYNIDSIHKELLDWEKGMTGQFSDLTDKVYSYLDGLKWNVTV